MRDERRDFVLRCVKLDEEFDKIGFTEPSDRVWVAVMLERIVSTLKRQEDIEGAYQQVLESLKDLIQQESQQIQHQQEENGRD